VLEAESFGNSFLTLLEASALMDVGASTSLSVLGVATSFLSPSSDDILLGELLPLIAYACATGVEDGGEGEGGESGRGTAMVDFLDIAASFAGLVLPVLAALLGGSSFEISSGCAGFGWVDLCREICFGALSNSVTAFNSLSGSATAGLATAVGEPSGGSSPDSLLHGFRK